MGKKTEKFFNWILSEQTYYNFQLIPGMCVMFVVIFLLMSGLLLFIWIALGGYGAYYIALRELRINYQQQYKQYRYIFSIIYDVDWRKPAVGWLIIDSNETYPIELAEKDKIEIQNKMYDKKINELKEKKVKISRLKVIAKNKVKQLKKSEKRAKKELLEAKDKKKTKEIVILEKKKKTYKIERKIRESHYKEIKKAIGKINDELEELDISKKALINVADKTFAHDQILDMGQERLKKDLYELNRYKNLRCKVQQSDLYENEELIMILPESFDNTFVFTPDNAYYSGLPIEVPDYSVATFLEIGVFKDIPYLIVIFSSYYVKKRGLMKLKKEIADVLSKEAMLAYFADEVSQIKDEYKTLKFDNLDLEKENLHLLDTLKKMDKRKRRREETISEINRFSADLPPKRLYLITILGWVIALILFVVLIYLFVFAFPSSENEGTETKSNETSSSIYFNFCNTIINYFKLKQA